MAERGDENMKQIESKGHNLQFEEMEEVEEFSLGGLGIGAMVVTAIAIVTQVFIQLF